MWKLCSLVLEALADSVAQVNSKKILRQRRDASKAVLHSSKYHGIRIRIVKFTKPTISHTPFCGCLAMGMKGHELI